MPDNQKPTSQRTARLIAEFMEADRWHPRQEGKGVVARALAKRDERYRELRSKTDFSSARLQADTEAIQLIMENHNVPE